MLAPLRAFRTRKRTDSEAIKMLPKHSIFDYEPASINWLEYQGFELVTADRVKVGIVDRVCVDESTGEQFLQVISPGSPRRALRVPTRVIGVITSKRLMLDVTEQNLGALHLEPVENDVNL
jgi:hypothetical protein